MVAWIRAAVYPYNYADPRKNRDREEKNWISGESNLTSFRDGLSELSEGRGTRPEIRPEGTLPSLGRSLLVLRNLARLENK